MEVEKKCDCQNFENYDNCKEKIDPELKVLIDKIAKKQGFTNYDLLVKNISPDGNNYLGVLTEVTVHDTHNNKDLNLFVKSIIPSADQVKMISVPEAYSTEVYLYMELSKLFDKFQADAQIPYEERYKFVRCYSESNTGHIIMENMVKKGFTVWNRFNVISLDFAEKAIKLLAKFHALGFVLHEKKPRYFEEKIMPMKYLFKFDEECLKFYKNMTDISLEYVEGNARSKLEKNLMPLFEKCAEYTKDQHSTFTLGHGDYRPNNILIKNLDGEISDMVPVDYQFINYCSPLMDLLYFIFGATDRQFRIVHLDYLKNLYYDTMKQFLKYFDMDVQKYYPKEEYEKLFKDRLDFGLFVGLWYLQANLASEDNIVDLSKTDITEVKLGKSDLAKMRIQELVDEFIEWGYL